MDVSLFSQIFSKNQLAYLLNIADNISLLLKSPLIKRAMPKAINKISSTKTTNPFLF